MPTTTPEQRTTSEQDEAMTADRINNDQEASERGIAGEGATPPLPTLMRAAVRHRYGDSSVLEVGDVAVPPISPTTVLVEDEARSCTLTGSILSRLPNAEVVVVERPTSENLALLSRQHSSQTTLLLALHRGRFLKACPGTAESYRCCLYQILHLGLGCNIGCSYCVLQGYLNNPFN